MYKLQAMKGKAVVAVLTVALATMGFVGTAFAANQTDVLATAGDPQIDVTVPLRVVAQVENDGEMTFPAPEYAKIENNSGFAVKVDELLVNEAPGFELVDGTATPVAPGKLMVTVNANGNGQISLDNFTTQGTPGASWVMNAANTNAIKLGFAGQADYDDFGQTSQEKVFDMVWTFDVA